jgi:hypothetical protein
MLKHHEQFVRFQHHWLQNPENEKLQKNDIVIKHIKIIVNNQIKMEKPHSRGNTSDSALLAQGELLKLLPQQN